MIIGRHIVFWTLTLLILVFLFTTSLGGILVSLFFVTFLFPVVLATSLFFNHYLVPRYLLDGRYLKFGLYSLYMFIISVYLELMVMVLAFVILADYQFDKLGAIAGDIYLMTVILYLIVLAYGFIEIIIGLKHKNQLLSQLEERREREKETTLVLKVDRKNVKVRLDDILYIESLSDYLRVMVEGETFITRERISTLEKTLPDNFVRIHRSFIINQKKISSFSKETVNISGQDFTIGRKYKSEALQKLEKV